VGDRLWVTNKRQDTNYGTKKKELGPVSEVSCDGSNTRALVRRRPHRLGKRRPAVAVLGNVVLLWIRFYTWTISKWKR